MSGGLLIVCQMILPSLCATEPPAPPNIILVMTDDQGYGDVGVHGNRMIRTPNMDRLHGESVHLTDYHVDPTCAPTRSALMTGRYSSRTGVWHTIMGRSLMRTDETTIAEVLAKHGYRTGIFGKWHLGDNFPCRPQDQGFQEIVIHGGGGVTQTPDYWGNDYFDDTYFHNGHPQKHTGYCTDVFFDEALAFIERSTDKPFFCYLPTNAPHGPFFVDPKYSRPYEEQGVPQPMANFYGMITNIDENLGRLRQRLADLDLADNTILIFTTDNGTAAGVARGKTEPADATWKGFSAGMRAQKGSEYDGGHRVPFFLHWPAGGFNQSRDIPQLTAHIDVLPTLLELCGIDLPEELRLDGKSLVPLLRGDNADWPERTLVVHSQRIEHPEKWRKSAVMTKRWRLINGVELYDIQAEPGQVANVASGHPQVVEELRRKYETWWKDISTRFDEYVPIVLGHPAANPTDLTAHDWHGETVPWNQEMIRRAPEANGFWAVDVVSPGRYAFTLRLQPQQSEVPLRAEQATVRVGNATSTIAVPDQATSIRLVLELPAGQSQLHTLLTSKDGTRRGAFFVTVERLTAP